MTVDTLTALRQIISLDPTSGVAQGRLLRLRQELSKRPAPSILNGTPTAAARPDPRLVELAELRANTGRRRTPVPLPRSPLSDLPPEQSIEKRPLTPVDLRQLDALPADVTAWTDEQCRFVEKTFRRCADDSDRRAVAAWRDPMLSHLERQERAARVAQAEAAHGPMPPLAGRARDLALGLLADAVTAEKPDLEPYAHQVAAERLAELEAETAGMVASRRAEALAAAESARTSVPAAPSELSERLEAGRQRARDSGAATPAVPLGTDVRRTTSMLPGLPDSIDPAEAQGF